MSKWRKRPVVIDAVQIPEAVNSNLALIPLVTLIAQAAESDRTVEIVLQPGGAVKLVVSSLEGELQGSYPDWLVIGTQDEPYIVAGAIFPDIYEPWDAEYEEGQI